MIPPGHSSEQWNRAPASYCSSRLAKSEVALNPTRRLPASELFFAIADRTGY